LSITVDPRDVLALAEQVARLEARIEEMRRRYEPTMQEQIEDMDDRAYACWG
jgi:hypothetical protein